MKNFKLLLATTAILSTSLAMGVLADDPITATMNVKLGFITPGKLYVEQDLDFGYFIPGGAGGITLNPKDSSLSASFNILVGTEHHHGVVSMSFPADSPKTISLPSTITLKSNVKGKSNLTLAPTFALIDESADTGENSATYGIGGTVEVDRYTTDPQIEGIYTGELTITAIEDTGA